MKKYIGLAALILVFVNLCGSESPKNKRTVGFSGFFRVVRYNGGMPITRDVDFREVSSQNFVLMHTTSFTQDEFAQNPPLYQKFLYVMGCTSHFRSPYSEKSK